MSSEDRPAWDGVQRRALGVGAAGLILCAGIGVFQHGAFFRGYLVAYNFWLGVALGCLAITMLYHLTGGGWGLILRRLLESATRTLPLLLVFFVPLLFGLHELYEWADPEAAARDSLLQHKSVYLNVPRFVAFSAGYFVIWLVIAYLLNQWSRDQDATADPRLLRRFRLLSAPGLVLYGLTITFASVDWVMSLDWHWYSTIFPVVFAIGQVLTGFAFATAAAAFLASRPPLADIVTPAHFQDLGNLLLAFVMFWAYVSFSQFLLIWSGNLPEEIRWYAPRFEGGWQWIGVGLILCQFAVPFLLLLSREVKRNPRALCRVAVLVLCMRFVDLMWQIVPAFPPGDLLGHWLDIATALLAWLGLGGIWMGVFVWQLKRMPLLPLHDPAFLEIVPHGREQSI